MRIPNTTHNEHFEHADGVVIFYFSYLSPQLGGYLGAAPLVGYTGPVAYHALQYQPYLQV